MNEKIQNIICIEQEHLTTKAPHTQYKINYVREYAREWTYVAEGSDLTNVNFIDCMCNAGVYSDGKFCSAMEVLHIFRDVAFRNHDKQFNILLNDYDADKIRIFKDIINARYTTVPNNLHIFFDNMDVNEYLKILKQKYGIFDYPSRTILYVDPYSFHTVIIDSLSTFINTTYCELIFNLLTYDFVRNKMDGGIQKVLGGNYNIDNVDELIEHINERLLIGKMKYSFAYPFRQSKNAEIYQIMFFTPHERGVDKLKDALWEVFDGAEYYRTDLKKEYGQMSIFDEDDNKEMNAVRYANEAKEMIRKKFKGQTVSYEELEKYIWFRSLLKRSQILAYVIKPMKDDGLVIKQNIASKSNYNKDNYLVK